MCCIVRVLDVYESRRNFACTSVFSVESGCMGSSNTILFNKNQLHIISHFIFPLKLIKSHEKNKDFIFVKSLKEHKPNLNNMIKCDKMLLSPAVVSAKWLSVCKNHENVRHWVHAVLIHAMQNIINQTCDQPFLTIWFLASFSRVQKIPTFLCQKKTC